MFARLWGAPKAEDKTQQASANVTNYQPIFIPCFNKAGDLRIAIRNYDYNAEPYYLAVDPYTLTTECAPVTNYSHRQIVDGKSNAYQSLKIESSPYITALTQFTSPPYQLQNYGMTHAIHSMKGAFLTIDMCPSVKPYEADFFTQLTTYSDTATPVAICITGLWMLNHPDEFTWLTDQDKNGKLNITWVNHSFSHTYYPDIDDLTKNFLLSNGTNQDHELLATEQLLIKKGLTPSVFFRAPGLVTDEKIVSKLNKFGLIPLGSDAWLANGEEPKDGSIILVHGNSNEHSGIEKASTLLAQKRFVFFPLATAVINETDMLAQSFVKI